MAQPGRLESRNINNGYIEIKEGRIAFKEMAFAARKRR